MDIIILWCFGAMMTTNWMLVWFGTGFPVHLFGRKDREDWNNYCEFKLPKLLGGLFQCCVCFSHWWSAAISALICWRCGLTWDFIAVSTFTWPLICYFILKKLNVVH